MKGASSVPKGAGLRSPSPLVKIVKISKLEEIKHNQLNFEGNFEPPYLWTVNSF